MFPFSPAGIVVGYSEGTNDCKFYHPLLTLVYIDTDMQ